MTAGGEALAQFVSKGHNYFAFLAGVIAVNNNPAMIEKLWSNPVEAWFLGGKSDPNLTLLRFDIASAELWESDMSLTGKLKMIFGGKIDPSEEGSHARVETTAVDWPAMIRPLAPAIRPVRPTP